MNNKILLLLTVFNIFSVNHAFATNLGKRANFEDFERPPKKAKDSSRDLVDKINTLRWDFYRNHRVDYLLDTQALLNKNLDLLKKELLSCEATEIAEIAEFLLVCERKLMRNGPLANLYSIQAAFSMIGSLVRELPKFYFSRELSKIMIEADFLSLYSEFKIASILERRAKRTGISFLKFSTDKQRLRDTLLGNYFDKKLRRELGINNDFFKRLKNEKKSEQTDTAEETLALPLKDQIETPAQAQLRDSEVFEEVVAAPVESQPMRKEVRFLDAVECNEKTHPLPSFKSILKTSGSQNTYVVDNYLLDDKLKADEDISLFLTALETAFSTAPSTNFGAYLLSVMADFLSVDRDKTLKTSFRNKMHLVIASDLYNKALNISPNNQYIVPAKNKLDEEALKKNNIAQIINSQSGSPNADSYSLSDKIKNGAEEKLLELQSHLLHKPAMISRILAQMADYIAESIERKNLSGNQEASLRARNSFEKTWKRNL